MKIYVLNGANLNLLGIREPALYGTEDEAALKRLIEDYQKRNGAEILFFQSNHEGDLVDWIQEAYADKADGIVINPGAYTHTSIAIRDALLAVGIPTVEVHITDPDKREAFRQVNYIRDIVSKRICGHGIGGYLEALDYLCGKGKTV